jgi:hypothetical protein
MMLRHDLPQLAKFLLIAMFLGSLGLGLHRFDSVLHRVGP